MIYLNITILHSWHRPPVGIVRTIFEVAKWLITHQSEEVCFFACQQGLLCALSHDDVSKTLDRLETLADHLAPERGVKENHYLQLFMRALHSFHHIARQALKAIIIRSGNKEKLIKNLMKTYQYVTFKNIKQKDTINPRSNDIILTLGADWDPLFTTALKDLQEKHQCKIVMFFHDGIPIHLPQFCPPDFVKIFDLFPKAISDLAFHVLCNSRATQRDLLKILEERSLKVPETSTVTLGSHSTKVLEPHKPKILGLEKTKFLLFVSTIEPRKNHRILYQAYDYLIAQGIKELPKIVCVGMLGWGVSELFQEIKRNPRTQDYFIFANHISDAELTWLYQNSLFTLFPSFYEGWGLPVAEALAHGKFCITSDQGSLPEVGGEYVEMVNPWDTVAWGEKILEYSRDHEKLRKREHHIQTHYQAPTWEVFCEDIYKTLSNLK